MTAFLRDAGGVPCLCLALADAGSAATKLPAGLPWLAVAPDSLSSARLSAGECVLVSALTVSEAQEG